MIQSIIQWIVTPVTMHCDSFLYSVTIQNTNLKHESSLISIISFNLLDHALFRFCSYMFFTDMGYANENMKLERAYMDGSNRIELVKNRLGTPMGITLDIVNKRVYWSDSHFDTVETVTYHGLDR